MILIIDITYVCVGVFANFYGGRTKLLVPISKNTEYNEQLQFDQKNVNQSAELIWVLL